VFAKLSVSAASAAVIAAGLVPGTASAAYAPLSGARIAVHYDDAVGQTPQDIALAPGPGGGAYVTFSLARQVAEVWPTGAIRVLATLPLPADGGVNTPGLHRPLTAGIVRAADGTLYFLYDTGTADLTGVWRLRPGGLPQRIAALPPNGLPNVLDLDPQNQTLYITDSELSTVWSVPVAGGTPVAWATGSQLAPIDFIGADGLKVHNGAVWVTNLDQGTILRIPILPNGRSGEIETAATVVPGIDNFAFTGAGDQILAALNQPSEVALVQPDGSYSIVLTKADGLENPASIAVRGDTVYVMSVAYTAGDDPNMLLAHLNR
jgi:hypothetical protein